MLYVGSRLERTYLPALIRAARTPPRLSDHRNIVSTVNLDCKLDLKKIALHARNAEYNPKRFAAVIMRIREPKTTSLIFASGKMVCTGAKSEEQSRLAARKYTRVIQKLGFKARFTEFKIQNIVGSCDVKFPIRLEGLQYAHSNYATVSALSCSSRFSPVDCGELLASLLPLFLSRSE